MNSCYRADRSIRTGREDAIDLTAGQADVSGRVGGRFDLMRREVGRHGRIARKALGQCRPEAMACVQAAATISCA